MRLKSKIFLAFLISCFVCHSQTTTRAIYSVDIIKVAQQNGKNVGTARLSIDNNGVVERNGYENEKVNINTFTKSIAEIIEKEQKVVKVEGDNDRRPGFQEPYNGQHVFITVIFQDDFDNEKSLKNKTCYRYRETNLLNSEKELSFFKYLSNSDLEIIKRLLQ